MKTIETVERPRFQKSMLNESNTDQINPFFVDEGQLMFNWKELQRQVGKIKVFVQRWNEFASPFQKIKTHESLTEAITSPRETFTRGVLTHESKLPARLQALIKEGKVTGGGRTVELPEGFGQIEEAARGIEINLRFIDIVDEKVVLSPVFFMKQVNRTVCFAVTPLQLQRLSHASELRDLIIKQDGLFKNEIIEAREQPQRFENTIRDKSHVGPLPHPLKYEVITNGSQFEKRVALNESWIVFGSKREFPFFKTGSTPGETFKLGHLEARPVLLWADQKVPDGVTVFPGKYSFIEGRIAKQD